jgi:glycerate 2-kinase
MKNWSLPYLEKTVFISLASDGLDNSEAAGAIGDEDSLKKSQAKKLNWREYIDNNDSFNFFKKLDDLIITGPTGTNVSDLIVIYKK